MSQKSSLIRHHRNLSEKVETLEKQRLYKRSFEHKAELLKLKKEKLKIKEQIDNIK